MFNVRRVTVALALTALLQGCVESRRYAEIPGAPLIDQEKAELENLGGNEGIVVGVTALAYTPQPGKLDLGPPGSAVAVLIRHDNGTARQLAIGPRQASDLTQEDVRTLSYLRPFAVRLPAGRVSFDTLTWQDHQALGATTYSASSGFQRPTALVSVLARHDGGASFDVRPGQVTYVGRIGYVSNVAPFAETHGKSVCLGVVGDSCVVRELFLDNAPDHDIPIIKQRIPALASRSIAVSPARSGGEMLRRWPRPIQVPAPPGNTFFREAPSRR